MYAGFKNEPVKTVEEVITQTPYSHALSYKSCLKWIGLKGCNSVKINFISIKTPHSYLHYVHKMYALFKKKKICYTLWKKLITQNAYPIM